MGAEGNLDNTRLGGDEVWLAISYLAASEYGGAQETLDWHHWR